MIFASCANCRGIQQLFLPDPADSLQGMWAFAGSISTPASSPSTSFHHEIEQIAGMPQVVYLNDVGVPQSRQHPCFVFEAIDKRVFFRPAAAPTIFSATLLSSFDILGPIDDSPCPRIPGSLRSCKYLWSARPGPCGFLVHLGSRLSGLRKRLKRICPGEAMLRQDKQFSMAMFHY